MGRWAQMVMDAMLGILSQQPNDTGQPGPVDTGRPGPDSYQPGPVDTGLDATVEAMCGGGAEYSPCIPLMIEAHRIVVFSPSAANHRGRGGPARAGPGLEDRFLRCILTEPDRR